MGDALRILLAVASAFVAMYVAFIGTLQWQTQQEKLRLDLYNRRFEIYLRVVDQVELLRSAPKANGSGYSDAHRAIVTAFRKAQWESQFLFSVASGVPKLIKDIGLWSTAILYNPVNKADSMQVSSNAYEAANAARSLALKHLPTVLDELEERIMPYMKFHEVPAQSPFSDLLDMPDDGC